MFFDQSEHLPGKWCSLEHPPIREGYDCRAVGPVHMRMRSMVRVRLLAGIHVDSVFSTGDDTDHTTNLHQK